ncbi:MAG TPA: DUF6069 family protein [Vicinamibacterales bacterium]|nr:DUF6069 family protein [Vicinamibacterales bacterium]
MGDQQVNGRRLLWVGPVTIVTAAVAVWIVQQVGVAVLSPLPQFSQSVLVSREPVGVTAVLVSAAVMTFAVLARVSDSPVTTFRRLALIVLMLSFVPNVAVALLVPQAGWPGMVALMGLHVVAWGVTIVMLTQLSVDRARNEHTAGN